MTISGLKPAYWADEVAHVQNAAGNPLFKQVELEWIKPTLWTDMRLPKFDCGDPFLYALVRIYGNSQTKNHIVGRMPREIVCPRVVVKSGRNSYEKRT